MRSYKSKLVSDFISVVVADLSAYVVAVVARLTIVILLLSVVFNFGFGAVSRVLNYQGRLTDSTGKALTGTYNITFSIYTTATGGSALWTETQSVTVTDGLFSATLGSVSPLNLSFDTDYYLGIKVGSDPEMSPRQRLTPAWYAINADTVDGKHATDFVTKIIAGTNITISPTTGVGDVTISASGGGAGGDMYKSTYDTNGNNKVDTADSIPWTSITSIPAGFADGVDDTGGGGLPAGTAGQTLRHDGTNWVADSNIFNNGTKVGIGTTGPAAKLHLNNPAGSNTELRLATDGSSDIPYLTFFTGGLGKASLQYRPDNTGLHFQTGGVAYPANVKVSILDNGNVGIGTTSPGNILTIVQNSATDPVADAWTVYSSKRWKTNIKPIENALQKVQKLRGVYFDWKADNKHDIGMIAEEVGEVVPEVVTYEDNGKDAKSLDYARLVALLIEAVKEQQKEIDELKAKLNFGQ